MKINVNGNDINVAPEDKITYEAIAGLAGYPGRDGLSVTYSWRGEGDLSRSGMLYRGQSVALAEGMKFDAVFTGNA